MKTHQILVNGSVKLNAAVYLDQHDFCNEKWVRKADGDFTVYDYDETQQQYMANCLLRKIDELVGEHIDRLIKEAKEEVGTGRIVK
jgi:hypothetical protein